MFRRTSWIPPTVLNRPLSGFIPVLHIGEGRGGGTRGTVEQQRGSVLDDSRHDDGPLSAAAEAAERDSIRSSPADDRSPR